jgi:hypothetical protein
VGGSALGECVLERLVVLLNLADEDALDVFAVRVEFCSLLVVVVHAEDVPAQVRLGDLGVDHQQVQHRHDLEKHLFLEVHVGNGLEGEVPLLPLRLARSLLDELQSDVVPTVGQVVAVEHQHVGVLHVQLDACHVLHAQKVLPRPKLHQVLPTVTPIFIFHLHLL